MRTPVVLAIAALVSLWSAARARACGCFAPPDPSVPVVQAGERILFARQDGVVTAHIQIQYVGRAQDFGWLLPLPSQPDLELGTDELFTQLIRTTQPRYVVRRILDDCSSGFSGGGGCLGGTSSAAAPFPDLPAPDAGAAGPAVVERSIGPYDYAVLHADSKDAMLEWLSANHYFVPAGTEDAVAPYIHPGAYFVALKLRSGESAGDIQPVVVKYASDLPMIPIILTSVAAAPDMGIQVWVLGHGRAVPRNYAHTVLDDAELDWVNGARDYNDVVVRATKEAFGRHTFITEHAGPSSVMVGALDPPGRFGSQAALAAQPDIYAFVSYLDENGFAVAGGASVYNATRYPSPLAGILASYAPMPASLAQLGITPEEFYAHLASYRYELAGWPASYEPAAMAADIFARVVDPTRRAAALFRVQPYLTRLYTTLSPEDMTRDPVFSENAALPPVPSEHDATLTLHCHGDAASSSTPATLETEQGYVIPYPHGIATRPSFAVPASRRIEALSDEGPSALYVDNDAAIAAALAKLPAADLGDPRACRLGDRRPVGGMAMLGVLVLIRIVGRRRRNQRADRDG